VRVLGPLFRRLFLTRLIQLHTAGRLAFFGTEAGLTDCRVFLRRFAAVRKLLACMGVLENRFTIKLCKLF
jgi:hypothetical protein